MPGLSASDANLEATFANLAFARLKDKAQSLLDYLVGFQMIDKNEEETHAVAVFGFKVGKEWVYAPVFYINGELKGHELLYVKSQDAFVPLTEKWVNYILNRRPKVLGEAEDTPRHELGIRQPDFDIMARAPYAGSKMASENPHAFSYIYDRLDNHPTHGRWAAYPMDRMFTVTPRHEKYACLQDRLTLDGALRIFGKQGMYPLFKTMQKDAKFARAVTKFYTIDQLVKAADCGVSNRAIADERDQMTKDQQGKDELPKPKVVTVGDDPDTFLDSLSEADRSKLLKDRYIVCDKRKDGQKTKLYKMQIATTINSPVKSGLYDIIVPSGERRRMFVGMNPIRLGYNRDPMTVVVDTESKKFGAYHNADVMTTAWHGKDDLEKMVNKLPAGDSLDIGDKALLVNPDGICTDVFSVDNRVSTPGGGIELKIWGSLSGSPSGPTLMPTRPRYNDTPFSGGESVNSIQFTDKENASIQILGRTMFVPKGFKALVIKSPSDKDRKEQKDRAKSRPSYCGENDSTDLVLASVTQAITDMRKEAALGKSPYLELQMLSDGIDFQTVINSRQSNRMSKLAALKNLVEVHGFGEEDALLIIKEARQRYPISYFMKYASPEGSQPIAGTFVEPSIQDDPRTGTQMQYPHQTGENLGQTDNTIAHEQNRRDRYVDDDAKQHAQAASQLGQKEVLDTSVISGLVKTMDADGTVDSYIGDLLLGLDRIGRILFMYYWHNDKFKERYGQQDMIELEDNLRNVFKNLGDLTLFLKQKTIEPEDGGESEVKLDEVLS